MRSQRRLYRNQSSEKSIFFETTSQDNPIVGNLGLVRGFAISNSGHRIALTQRSPDRVSQWGLSVPGDYSTIYSIAGELTGQLSDPRAIRFSPDGTKFYYGRYGIREFNLTTPYDVSTAINTGRYLNPKYAVSGFDLSHDGTKVYITDLNNHIVEYTLTTPWQITPATLNPIEIFVFATDSTTGELTANNGLCDEMLFLDNGKIMVVFDRLTNLGAINIYKTSTPYIIESYVLEKRLTGLGNNSNSSVTCGDVARDLNMFFTPANKTNYTLV